MLDRDDTHSSVRFDVGRRLRGDRFLVLIAALVVVASCSSGGDTDPGISAADVAESSALPSPEPSDEPVASAVPTPPTTIPELNDVEGLIVSSGVDGLRVVRPTGEDVMTVDLTRPAAQPTWSRDGSRLIASLGGPGDPEVAIVDVNRRRLDVRPARRSYFFFSWSADDSSIMALGNDDTGAEVATDVLDNQGVARFPGSITGTTIFGAWEPTGPDLVLHAGLRLVAVDDPGAGGELRDLGVPGAGFLAPSWIPGTRSMLHTVSDTDAAAARLVRTDVDTLEQTDLGRTFGVTQISVHPDGSRAAIAHSEPDPSGVAAPVEMVDIATGARTPIGADPATWLEWSPDGERLLLVVPAGNGLRWNVFDGQTVTDLGPYEVSSGYATAYLSFADAYVESRRLWSPDGKAIVFTELVDGISTATVLRLDDGSRWRLHPAEVAFFGPGSAPDN